MNHRKPSLQKFRKENPRIDYYPTPDAAAAIERLRQSYPSACTRELVDTLVVKGCNAMFPEKAATSKG